MYPVDLLDQLMKTGEPIAVQFTPKVEDGVNEMNALMKAHLINVTHEDNNCHKLTFSMNEFLEFNKTVATPDFYDDNNVPCLTWFETDQYPTNGIVETYVDSNCKVDIFNIINDDYKILLTYEINGVPQLTLLNNEDELTPFINQHPHTKLKAFKVFDKHEVILNDQNLNFKYHYPCTGRDCGDRNKCDVTCKTQCSCRKSINEGGIK